MFEGTPNIVAELNYPMYIDNLADGTLVVSNFGDARLYRIDVERKRAELFVMFPLNSFYVKLEACTLEKGVLP